MAEINGIKIQSARSVVPKIYAYTTPEIKRHEGWTKIGYTEQDDVKKRIQQQSHTIDVIANYEWSGNAIFENSNERFTDKQFHTYLRKQGVKQEPNTEWLQIEPRPAHMEFYAFRENKGVLQDLTEVSPYHLREEQADAVQKAYDYVSAHPGSEFLWNCKPRFGKTLAAYDLCKRLDAKNVLIVTNRPAISTSWYADYTKFLGTVSGYYFISTDGNLKEKPLVMDWEQFTSFKDSNRALHPRSIVFVSLQDLKGSVYFGTGSRTVDKLEYIRMTRWDVLIIDEAHEGVDTYKTDRAFDRIRRNFTLHLSGTPFKALANNKFPDEAIYNWTYADEQRKKAEWDKEEENPYAVLPQLNLFTYQMSEIVKDTLEQGYEADEDTYAFAFTLSEFFAVNSSGKFIHEDSVDAFLDALTTQEKFPFSTPELRDELKHTFWLLNRVNSAKALAAKLREHPIFRDYKVVLAVGNGHEEEEDDTPNMRSYQKVMEAIEHNDKTITLSVKQLTTGVTIPQWSAVLMLGTMSSPALYMQAAFRAQNPCLYQEGTSFKRKENAYVFDFDPARTLTIFDQFASDLSSAHTNDTEAIRKENVKKLLNFFPVYGEDPDGKMIALDAAQVLRFPHKIKAKEVVRRGFMSNYLFQNISSVFGAPSAVMDILKGMQPAKEQKSRKDDPLEHRHEVQVDEEGNIDVPESIVVGQYDELFGESLYETATLDDVDALLQEPLTDSLDTFAKKANDLKENIQEIVQKNVIDTMIEQAQQKMEQKLTASKRRQLEKELGNQVQDLVSNVIDDYEQTTRDLSFRQEKELSDTTSSNQQQEIHQVFDELKKEAAQKLQQSLDTSLSSFVEEAGKKTIEKIETTKQEAKKKDIEEETRDRLRGFTRTIPSFLMAYGNDTIVLANFDTIIPDAVFKEVTGITLDQFRFLRDGGDYLEETGETKHFKGHFFNERVFNDSITEFLALKDKLSDYFDEEQKEDIFDYIPPQKTNQIFTPKWVVKKMVDMLEEEEPGCFSDPDKTFADLYMKSGLYITEIVKKLYNDAHMKELFPNKEQRLQHIFAKQVYGLAPTEIIYRIALNYILGFDIKIEIPIHHFKQVDALPYAKEGRLKEKIDELFGNDEE